MVQNDPVFNQAKLPEIVYKSPVYSSALCNNLFERIWIFLDFIWKTSIGTIWTPRTICAWFLAIVWRMWRESRGRAAPLAS